MTLTTLDHVNIRTARLGEMTAFYAEVLGLRPGARPPFRFNGAWLYCNGVAALHLSEVAREPQAGDARIHHFAFNAKNLSDFLQRLRELDIGYQVRIVPGLELRQVNIHDPDGNLVEIAFAADEQADLDDYPGGA